MQVLLVLQLSLMAENILVAKNIEGLMLAFCSHQIHLVGTGP